MNGTVKAVEADFVLDDLDVLIVGRSLGLAQQHEFLVYLNRQTQEPLVVLILFRRHLASTTLNRWGMPAITVDPWRRQSSSKSRSTAKILSASLVSGVRCWATSYRRH